MKKIISVLLCLAIIAGCTLAFSGCSKQGAKTADIVLITDGDTVSDDGYMQGAWDGVTSFGDENSMTYNYYQPKLNEDGELEKDTVAKYVELAVNSGAKFVILPGEVFAVSAYENAPLYPNVNFVLIDAYPHAEGETEFHSVPNVMSVKYSAIEAGFLAGYLAVANGETKLGYFGEYSSDNSSAYGSGYVQGAAYAAEEKGVPVSVDWSEYDSPFLDYNYSFDVIACYTEAEEGDRKVVVENGKGSGTYAEGSNVAIIADPAPEGQVFDHWDVKSNTDGIKDKKINISDKNSPEMNLITEKADCTLTAVYKDIEGSYVPVTIMGGDKVTPYMVISADENSDCWVEAPVASENMVFDHWESSVADAVENPYEKGTKVFTGTDPITLTPVYVLSDVPTFNITVSTAEGGNGTSTGNGSYLLGDKVEVVAAVPQDGYKFSHWMTTDSYGNSAGISMENEFYPDTTFEMVDRYAALCEEMYNNGVTTIFTGGNSKVDSAFTAMENYDFPLSVTCAGEKNKDAALTVVCDYGEAVKDCLADFKGGTILEQNCSTNGFWATSVSEDEAVKQSFDAVYQALAEGKINLIATQEGGAGFEFCNAFTQSKVSSLLTLNGNFIDNVITFTEEPTEE